MMGSIKQLELMGLYKTYQGIIGFLFSNDMLSTHGSIELQPSNGAEQYCCVSTAFLLKQRNFTYTRWRLFHRNERQFKL